MTERGAAHPELDLKDDALAMIDTYIHRGVLQRYRGGLRRVGALRLGQGSDLRVQLVLAGYEISRETFSKSGEPLVVFAKRSRR